MRSSHKVAITTNQALDRLNEFVRERDVSDDVVEDFHAFEERVRSMVAAVEREVVAKELARLDVDAPAITVRGVTYRRVLKCEETYFGASGGIRVERCLYTNRSRGERSICPMEERAGIVEGRWTPLAASQAAFVVAHLTPKDGEELFARLGGMTPSKSSLDRLPKQLSNRWEGNRQEFEAQVRTTETVPETAAIVAVSLDGVMVPMKDGQRATKRAQAAKAGKQTRGPAGYREAGCATLSFYDGGGEYLSATRIARMPETRKQTLKGMLREELAAVLQQRPDLEVVKIADGARDNWEFLSNELPDGEEVVDFYHACEQLSAGLDSAYGEGNVFAKAQFAKLRRKLKEDEDGVAKVTRSLIHLRRRFPRRKKIREALGYFRKNRHRMEYARLIAEGVPIGSGVVEATCKTLVTQRLKRSGMRWSVDGGQAILTIRAWTQSNRFDVAWRVLAATYRSEPCVHSLAA